MRYGIPYQGSKNTITEWVVDNLPSATLFIDLFAGGCAVTHAAMLSGKYQRFMANDLTEAPEIFKQAAQGEFKGLSTVLTREEFQQSDDDVLKLLYSFGNNRTDYLWSRELEPVKVAASRMLAAPSLHERRMAYRTFLREFDNYRRHTVAAHGKIEGPQGSERLNRMENLERLQGLQGLQGLEGLQGLQGLERLERLETSRLDYRRVGIPDVPGGVCVYADPPYRDTGQDGYAQAGTFDVEAFDRWLADIPCMVIVSEYTCPSGCVEITAREKTVTMSANQTGKRMERLFVQERYMDEYRQRMKQTTSALFD